MYEWPPSLDLFMPFRHFTKVFIGSRKSRDSLY